MEGGPGTTRGCRTTPRGQLNGRLEVESEFTAHFGLDRDFALRDQELLRRQVAMIDPYIIVCCGKDMSFGLAKEIFFDASNARVIHENRNSIWGRCLKGQQCYWIDYVHPSMRSGTREDKYLSLLELASVIP